MELFKELSRAPSRQVRPLLQRYGIHSTRFYALRKRYFPAQETLFDTSDLEEEEAETGIPPFTPEQLREITHLLKVVRTL